MSEKRIAKILAFIRSYESQGYDDVYGGARKYRPEKPLTEMTIGEVVAWQRKLAHRGISRSAAGAYQFLTDTLIEAKNKLGMSMLDKFSQANQDKLATYLLKRRGLDKYLSGEITPQAFGNNLAKEWAALPVLSNVNGSNGPIGRGQSYYHGGVNKAGVSADEFENVLQFGTSPSGSSSPQARSGGLPMAKVKLRSGMMRNHPLTRNVVDTVALAIGSIDPNLTIVVTSAGQLSRDEARKKGLVGVAGGHYKGFRHNINSKDRLGRTLDFYFEDQNGIAIRPRTNKKLFLRAFEALAHHFPGMGHYGEHIHVGGGPAAAWGPSGKSKTLDPEFAAAYNRGREGYGKFKPGMAPNGGENLNTVAKKEPAADVTPEVTPDPMEPDKVPEKKGPPKPNALLAMEALDQVKAEEAATAEGPPNLPTEDGTGDTAYRAPDGGPAGRVHTAGYSGGGGGSGPPPPSVPDVDTNTMGSPLPDVHRPEPGSTPIGQIQAWGPDNAARGGYRAEYFDPVTTRTGPKFAAGRVIGAEMADSVFVRAYDTMTDGRPTEVDPTFNAYDHIRSNGDQAYWRYLSQAHSAEDYKHLKGRLSNELIRESVASRGGLLTNLASSALMLENFLGGGVIARAGVGGGLKGASMVGVASMALEAVNEFGRAQFDPNRGFTEVASNIGMAGMFGTGFGLYGSAVKARQFKNGLETESALPVPHDAGIEPGATPFGPAPEGLQPEAMPLFTKAPDGGQTLFDHLEAEGAPAAGGARREEYAGKKTITRQIDEEMDAEAAATVGIAAWTNRLRLGRTDVRVRRNGLPRHAPEGARSNGFFYDSARKELHIDPDRVYKLYEEGKYKNLGIADNQFRNTFEFEEFLMRYALKLEEQGLSASLVQRKWYVVGERGPIAVEKMSDMAPEKVGKVMGVLRTEAGPNGEILKETVGVDFDLVRRAYDEQWWNRERPVRATGEVVPPVADLFPEGVTGFASYADFLDYILAHERMHSFFRRTEAMQDPNFSLARYEMDIDRMAFKDLGLGNKGNWQGKADQQAKLDRAANRALREFENWRKGPFKREIKNRIAKGIDRLMPTAFKAVMRNAKSATTRMLAEVLANDASLVAMGRQIGATVGESVEMAGRIWQGKADSLMRIENKLYEEYLGHANNPDIGGMSLRKEAAKYKDPALASGEKAIDPDEFAHRATMVHMTGDAKFAQGIPQVEAYAREIQKFFDAFEGPARETGVFGPMTPEVRDARLAHLQKRIDATDRNLARKNLLPDDKKIYEQQRKAFQDAYDETEAANVLGAGKAKDSDYFTRIWFRQAIQQYPKTFRDIVKRYMQENDTFAARNSETGKWEKVQGDPRSLDERVDKMIHKLTNEESFDVKANGMDSLMRQEFEAHPIGKAQPARRRTFDAPNKLFVGLTRDMVHPDERHLMKGDTVNFMETNPTTVAMFYAHRMGHMIEYSRRFADPVAGINADLGFNITMKQTKAVERKAFVREWMREHYKGPEKTGSKHVDDLMAREDTLENRVHAATSDEFRVRTILEGYDKKVWTSPSFLDRMARRIRKDDLQWEEPDWWKAASERLHRGGKLTGDEADLIATEIDGFKFSDTAMDKAWMEHWGKIERDMIFLRDRVMSRVVLEPSRMDNRIARTLKNLTYPIYLGMSGLVTTIDATRMIAAFGADRTFGAAALALGKNTRGLFKQAAETAQKAGALSDMTLGLTARRLSEMATDPIHMTQFERGAEWLGSKSFLANFMAPITQGMRAMSGVMGQDDMLRRIAKSVLDPEDISVLTGHGLNEADIRAIKKMIDDGEGVQLHRGEGDKADLYLANVDEWPDQRLAQKFQAALHQMIDNIIIIASAADKPNIADGVLHLRKTPVMNEYAEKFGWTDVGDYWRVQSGLIAMPVHLMNYMFAATQKVAIATIENPKGQALGAFAAMVGMGYMFAQMRTPEHIWDDMDGEDRMMRALDQSGALGVLPDILWAAQGAVASTTGVNIMPFDPKFKGQSAGEWAFGLLGPGADIVGNVAGAVGKGVTGEPGAAHSLGMAAPFRNNVLIGDFVQSILPDDR